MRELWFETYSWFLAEPGSPTLVSSNGPWLTWAAGVEKALQRRREIR